MRATAPNADLRAFQSRARSSASTATRTLRAPCSRQIRSIAAVCAVTPSTSPHTSTSRTASASRGRPAPTKSSTARVACASIISIAAGTMPGRDHGRDRGGGVVDRGEVGEQRADLGRVGHEPHRDAGGDAHRPLAPHERSRAGRDPGASGPNEPEDLHRAVGQHHLHREHVGRGDARRRGSAGRRRWCRRCRRCCTPAATTGRARSAARGGRPPG